MLRDILLVALGGGAGSAARFLVGWGVAARLPNAAWLGTLAVNLVGCFVIGLLYALARRSATLTPSVHLLLATGALGGFTTFSTFSLDVMRAVEAGRPALAGAYVVASVAGGVAGCALGLATGKALP